MHRYCFVLDRSLCMARDLLENKNELPKYVYHSAAILE